MKKKILILWENAYMFAEMIAPRIPEFAAQFEVHVALVGCAMPQFLLDQLISMSSNGFVKEFWIIPDSAKRLKHHTYIGSMIKEWRKFKFDICLSGTDIAAVDKYFYECVLPPGCLRVCFQPSIGFLLQNEKALRISLGKPEVTGEENVRHYGRIGINKALVIFKKIRKRLPTLLSPTESIRYSLRLLRGILVGVVCSKAIGFTDKYVFPLLMAGKIFPQNKFDKARVPGSGRADAYIFCDSIEAELFARLTERDNIYVAQYPTLGNCRCNGSKEGKSVVLVPLTGFDDDHVPQQYIEMICRDIQIVSKESGAKSFHLRPHPGYKDQKWPFLLRDIIRDTGIDVECFNNNSIREVMCDYLGMAGLASNALKDGRAACNSAFVVGFVGPSKTFFEDPKCAYGKSEGIGWIEEDGSYDPAIFKTHNYFPKEIKSVIEIIKELSDVEN